MIIIKAILLLIIIIKKNNKKIPKFESDLFIHQFFHI
jgi:hypothetical protein